MVAISGVHEPCDGELHILYPVKSRNLRDGKAVFNRVEVVSTLAHAR